MKFITAFVAFTVGTAGAAYADTASAALKDLQGKTVGTLELSETPSGALLVKGALSGLPAGAHAFHIHEHGACDAQSKFESAGAHLAGGKSHGILHQSGPHPGDMPNIDVAKDGTAKVEVFIPGTAKGGWFAAANVFDADGAALVVHAKADDHMTQPAGDAGDRIACGTLSKK